MVVPAEIIHVAHAQSLRTYLGEHARRLIIVDPEELWFEGTLQGAVLLLAEKKSRKQNHSEGLGIYPVRGRSFLQLDAEDVFNAPDLSTVRQSKGNGPVFCCLPQHANCWMG